MIEERIAPFRVTVKVTGRTPKTYTVEAPARGDGFEGAARTRAMVAWLRDNDAEGGDPLRGSFVGYDVEYLEAVEPVTGCRGCGSEDTVGESDFCLNCEDVATLAARELGGDVYHTGGGIFVAEFPERDGSYHWVGDGESDEYPYSLGYYTDREDEGIVEAYATLEEVNARMNERRGV